jgi:L-proline amide hydrolase
MVKEIHGLIPGSKWELFAESSHMPHVEEPAKFKRVVAEFLDSTD